MNITRNVQLLKLLPHDIVLVAIKVLAINVAVDQRTNEAMLLDCTLQLFSTLLRLGNGQDCEARETLFVLLYSSSELVVCFFAQQRRRCTWSMGDHLQGDLSVIHVAESALVKVL